MESQADSPKSAVARGSVAVAACVSVALMAVALGNNTWAVGGSDSSCYGLMADAFAAGRVQPLSGLAADAPWPNVTATVTPVGFYPSPTRSGGAAPICAPGFGLLLAPLRVFGLDGIFLIAPLAALALAGSAFWIARALAGGLAGALATVLVATSPIVLFQVGQPMNDIATAASWTGVLAISTATRRRTQLVGTGLLTGLALLIRPNLAPLALVVASWVAWTARVGDPEGSPRQGSSLPGNLRRGDPLGSPEGAPRADHRAWVAARDLITFGVCVTPFLAVIALLNAQLYGAPLATGYGDPGDLFGTGNVAPNLRGYGRALLETHGPLTVLALAAPFLIRYRSTVWLALGVCAATITVYLLYRHYPEWWYLRFLLPALVPLLALEASVVAASASRAFQPALSLAVVLAVAVLSAGFGLWTARARGAFEVDTHEARFRRASEVVRGRLDANAVVLTVWESGSVRYHARREIVRWDELAPAWLDRSVEWLRQHGMRPVVLVERWEEPFFRERFEASSRLGGLDWPPRFDIDRQVRIFDPADRAPYFSGEFIPTELVVDFGR